MRAGAVKSDEGVLPDDGMLVFTGAFLHLFFGNSGEYCIPCWVDNKYRSFSNVILDQEILTHQRCDFRADTVD